MGKYFFYVIAAFVIAFALNFFDIVSIPWLDVPVSLEDKETSAEKTKEIHREADEALGINKGSGQ